MQGHACQQQTHSGEVKERGPHAQTDGKHCREPEGWAACSSSRAQLPPLLTTKTRSCWHRAHTDPHTTRTHTPVLSAPRSHGRTQRAALPTSPHRPTTCTHPHPESIFRMTPSHHEKSRHNSPERERRYSAIVADKTALCRKIILQLSPPYAIHTPTQMVHLPIVRTDSALGTGGQGSAPHPSHTVPPPPYLPMAPAGGLPAQLSEVSLSSILFFLVVLPRFAKLPVKPLYSAHTTPCLSAARWLLLSKTLHAGSPLACTRPSLM